MLQCSYSSKLFGFTSVSRYFSLFYHGTQHFSWRDVLGLRGTAGTWNMSWTCLGRDLYCQVFNDENRCWYKHKETVSHFTKNVPIISSEFFFWNVAWQLLWFFLGTMMWQFPLVFLVIVFSCTIKVMFWCYSCLDTRCDIHMYKARCSTQCRRLGEMWCTSTFKV